MKRSFWFLLLVVLAASVVAGVYFVASYLERDSLRESYPESNYTAIEDGLYLGGILSAPPPGVQAVLNVSETRDPYNAEVHRWEPIADLGPAPSLDWLRSQVAFIDEQRKAGRPVYVHCRAGVNRSAMVTAAYLMWRDKLTRDDALAAIRSKRPRIGPYPVYHDFLAEWEKSLQ